MEESFDLGALLGEFRDEAQDQVDRLDAGLLRLERDGTLDQDTRRELLRHLHTLKGNAGMLGLGPIRDFVHALEEVLRGDTDQLSPAILERLFEGAGVLRRAVEQAGGAGEPEAFGALAALGRRLANASTGEAPSAAAGEARQPEEEGGPGPADDRLRVPFAKLDVLLNEVGELMGEAEALVQAVDASVREQAEAVRRRGDHLRDAVMALRLVPLGRVLGRFPALVRRLAREQEKEARLIVEGESTEVDKSTADALAEPLLHLVRNAIDHGIEPPEVRERQGKPRHGTVWIRAAQVGDEVRIEVQDDGVGLDLDAIRRRAARHGVDADSLADDAAAALIFLPGLSTRPDVSTVSGRGVGLDVAQRSAQSLQGTLDVEAGPEGGTRFVLRLPLTVAIVPSLVFETAGETVALPTSAVDRTVPLRRVERVGATEVLRDGDDLVPVVDLDTLFQWPAEARGGFGVIVRHGRGSAVVAAGRLVDQRSLVVKALPPYGARPTGVSGASVLPGGRVILMLDPAELVELGNATGREPNR